MTHLVERLAQLRRHLDHLRALRPRVSETSALEQDLSLHNDVLISLLTVCRLVIDISGELSARRLEPFEDYIQAVRNLSKDGRFHEVLVKKLVRLPGFRNVLVHEYVALDLDRVMEALHDLDPIEEFVKIVAAIESEE